MRDKLIIKNDKGIAYTYFDLEDELGKERRIMVCSICHDAMPDKHCPFCQMVLCEACVNELGVCSDCHWKHEL